MVYQQGEEFENESENSEESETVDGSPDSTFDSSQSTSEAILDPAPESPDDEEECKEVDFGDDIPDDWYMPETLVAPNIPVHQDYQHKLTPIPLSQAELDIHTIPGPHAAENVTHDALAIPEAVPTQPTQQSSKSPEGEQDILDSTEGKTFSYRAESIDRNPPPSKQISLSSLFLESKGSSEQHRYTVPNVDSYDSNASTGDSLYGGVASTHVSDRESSGSTRGSSNKVSEGSMSNVAVYNSPVEPRLSSMREEMMTHTANTRADHDDSKSDPSEEIFALHAYDEMMDDDTPIMRQISTWSSSSSGSDYDVPGESAMSAVAISNELTQITLEPNFLNEVQHELSTHNRFDHITFPQPGTNQTFWQRNRDTEHESLLGETRRSDEGTRGSALDAGYHHRRKRLTKLLMEANLLQGSDGTEGRSDENQTQETRMAKSEDVQYSTINLMRTEKRMGIKALVAGASFQPKPGEGPLRKKKSSAKSYSELLRSFETLLGALLQLSDELELWSSFDKTSNTTNAIVSVDAMKAVLGYAPALNQVFSRINPILENLLEEGVEVESGLDALMTRAYRIVQLLCDVTYRVCQRQQWNPRAETAFVTLLELLDRTVVEVTSIYNEDDIPEFRMSTRHRRAWVATGHVQELKALFVQTEQDSELFRQICYDVLISTDYWCPEPILLGKVCGVITEQAEELHASLDARMAPIPPPAMHVLDSIDGMPLPRAAIMNRVLRHVLPPSAVRDPSIARTAFSLPKPGYAGNVLAISAAAEVLNDSESLGLEGVGKTTVAAMVASHDDVRRFFRDGVLWVHVGSQPLTYRRYTQCLRELCSQLVFYDGIPLFAELLHTPGESTALRRRREEGFMMYARDAVAELLRMRNVLLVLDDVMYASDVEWFRFSSAAKLSTASSSISSSDGSFYIIATTRCRDLLPKPDTIEVDLLDDVEAMKLFLMESGYPPDHEISSSQEARSIVLECANHPMAIKSVARWMRLKRATSGVINSTEEIYNDLDFVSTRNIGELIRNGKAEEANMTYEIMNISFSPFVNGQPTPVIKFCYAAFVDIFYPQDRHSKFFATSDVAHPLVPMEIADLLFQAVLNVEKDKLFYEGSPFYESPDQATHLILEALSALGVLKIVSSTGDGVQQEEDNPSTSKTQMFLLLTHTIQREYGEYLSKALQGVTSDTERRWNRAFAEACLSPKNDWAQRAATASKEYTSEMIISHMIRGELFEESAALLSDKNFVRSRLYSLGPENATYRQIEDCEILCDRLREKQDDKAKESLVYMEWAYRQLSETISRELSEKEKDEAQELTVESGRANFEMGLSLAEKGCWKPAILHWEQSRKMLASSLGVVEFVAAILFNMGVALSQLNQYDRAMEMLKQSLQVRRFLHGEEHVLYAQTIRKIGDVFLQMNDYDEALESYSWALEIFHLDLRHNRLDVGDILERKGDLHYLKGDVAAALSFFESALESKRAELGKDDPELASTYQRIGNCLSDRNKTEDALRNFDDAIRVLELDPSQDDDRDAMVFSLQGVTYNLKGLQDEGLECYEKALDLLKRATSNKDAKIAELLNLIGCVYLVKGEHLAAMKLFEESLQTRRKNGGFVHVDTSSVLLNMAFLHQARDHPKKALRCLEEALKIRQLRLPESEKVAVTQEQIGALAKALRKRHKAEIAFEEALRLRIVINGREHKSVSAILCELGALMNDFNEFEEAMTYFVEALEIRRKTFGDDHESVASVLYSMGFTLYNAGRYEGAMHCIDEALIIRKSQQGDDATKEVGDTLNMLGYLKAKLGHFNDALSLLLEALAVRKYHNDKIKMAETLMNLGNVCREKGENDLALGHYKECLSLRRSELGDDHGKVADALIAIGNIRSDMELMNEAMKAYEGALAIRSASHGDNDEMVAKLYQYMGMMEFRFGDSHRAKQLLEEFVRIRRKNETDNDGEFVNVLFIIGNIHKMNNERHYAQKNWSEAYSILQDRGLTKENPQLEKAMRRLLDSGEGSSGIPNLLSGLKDEKIPQENKGRPPTKTTRMPKTL